MISMSWEYWPKPVDGTTGDPICREIGVKSLAIAYKLTTELKEKYGKDLRFVDVRQRLFSSSR